MKIYNRKLQTYEESSQYGGNLLEILYNKKCGRILMKFVIHPFFSQIYGVYQNSRLSRRKIAPFVEKYEILLEDYEDRTFQSFNDFFTRKIKPGKRPVDMDNRSFVAPADSKLSVYEITKEQLVQVKGVEYTLGELVSEKLDIADYAGGYCLVFRLSMEDYHHYSYVDDGEQKKSYLIPGKLHTVSSISKEHKIYRENSRVVNVLQTENFGEIIWIEVGALLVGKIKNNSIETFQKGMEKGYFELGGSTLILLIKPDVIRLDDDIRRICQKGVEVKVQLGEKIATRENR